MIDWNIQARAHACQICRKPFADKEALHTVLFDQDQGYERSDLCDACWHHQVNGKTGGRPGYISYWQSIYTQRIAGSTDPIQKETAESLLRKLVEENNPAHAAARFILAAMLERKRLLKVKAQIRQGGQRTFIYEHAQSGDLFNVPDPELRLDQLEEVQRDVAALLEHGLTSSSSSGSEAAATVAELPLEQTGDSTESAAPEEARSQS